jgi:hypothetical protein
MPDALKNGAKAALAAQPDGYKQFTNAAKELKEGKTSREQAVAVIQKLLATKPGRDFNNPAV